MRTRLFGALLLLFTFIFLTTACASTNNVVSPSNTNKQTDVSSSGRNTPTESNGSMTSETIKTVSFTD